MYKLDMESKDIIKSNQDKIIELFPNCVQEGKIDFDVLKQELCDVLVDDKKEKYQLNWPGKREALLKANTKTNSTLRPLTDKSINFDETHNIYIEGDNLEVLKLLQESYLNKIDCIYIDPPYNTGADFIYNDKFTIDKDDELLNSGQIDETGNRLVSNLLSDGRFHTNWINMIYPRLKLARNLLSNQGLIFISIDDNEVWNLKKICDEIFGESSFVCNFVWKSKPQGGNDNGLIATEHEYILLYAKSKSYAEIVGRKLENNKYNLLDEFVKERGRYSLTKLDLSVLPYRYNLDYPITAPDGTLVYPGNVSESEWNSRKNGENKDHDWRWRWSKERFEAGIEKGYVEFKKNGDKWTVYTKEYEFIDNDGNKIDRLAKHRTIIDSISTQNGTRDLQRIFDSRIFSYPKPVELIKHFISMTHDNATILDFFSGSGTTGQAVLELNNDSNSNRKFILVQLPEKIDNSEFDTICDLGEYRIKKAWELVEDKKNIDYGFRTFKVDTSNMKEIYYKPSELEQANLFDYISNIKEDRNAEDLLIQIILDLGLPLDLPMQCRKINNNNVYFVADNALVACFDDSIDINIIEEICKCAPLKVVFKDTSFKTDKDKINLEEKIKKLSADTEISIL